MLALEQILLNKPVDFIKKTTKQNEQINRQNKLSFKTFKCVTTHILRVLFKKKIDLLHSC